MTTLEKHEGQYFHIKKKVLAFIPAWILWFWGIKQYWGYVPDEVINGLAFNSFIVPLFTIMTFVLMVGATKKLSE